VRGRSSMGVWVVTGGCSGIGKEVASVAFEKGHKVAALDMTLNSFHPEILFLKCDVADYSSFEDALNQVARSFGPIDVLVNNAGINESRSFHNSSAESWRRVIDVNLMGVIYGTALLLSTTKQPVSIINVSSMSGLVPLAVSPVYSASKHGVVGFSRSIALQVRTVHRVNCVCPSFVDTPLVQEGKQNNQEFSRLVQRIGKGKLIDPRIVAACIVGLAQDESKNGQIMRITFEKGIDFHPLKSAM